MEANKDSALELNKKAQQYITEGKFDRAEQALNRSIKLYPTDEAQALLEKVKTEPRRSTASASPSRNKAPRTASPSTSDRKEDATPSYTQEQLRVVTKINTLKDFYKILGVEKDTPDSDIKKAYKKLALQVHPDKNKAPGSAEAFKALGNAVAILTDPEKRKRYDLYGDETQATKSRSSYQRFNTSDFETDITAEEIFSMFFSGGYPSQNLYARQRRFHSRTGDDYVHARARQQHDQQQQQTSYGALINLLPILILIALSMVSSFFIMEPIYSLHSSMKYSVPRETNALKIRYYVKENFHSEYSGSLGRLEATVEEDYLTNMKHNCYRERNYREASLMKARNLGDRELYNKAKSLPTPSCDNLYKYQN